MAGLELVLLLLAASAGLRLIAERVAIPYAAILVVGGLLLALIPGLPRVTLPPDVLFLVFVPPLLYWGAASYALRDFRRQLGPIVRLAILLVLVSTAAVAVVARTLHPSFSWAAAITLGAIVSPPDPVAVLSVARSLRAPRLIESILEGEGLVNDATALVIYRLAVAAAVTGSFAPSHAALDFVLAAAGGVAIGLVVGMIVTRVHHITRSVPAVSATVSLLTPFASYLPAELVGASGILSVVAAAMYASRRVPKLVGPETRVLLISIWTVVTFILESLVFILVGLELPSVLQALERLPLTLLLREAAIVTLCLVLVRLVWVIPSAYGFKSLGRLLRISHEPLPSWQSVLFVAWAGLRGGDSLVLALALPLQTASGARFPAREQIIFITFCVIFATLVVQGPTLAPMLRWLGLSVEKGEAEESHARLVVAESGLRKLDDPALADSPYPEVIRYLRQRHRQRARRWAAVDTGPHDGEHRDGAHDHFIVAPSHEAGALDERRAAEYRRVRSAMLDAEQNAVVELRDDGAIAYDVMRRIQRDLDLETLLLQTSEPVGESVNDIPSRQ
ncbi:MAG TPA: Na+/H+ antiporter [Gemmatimonadaceae bacterium]